MNELAALGLILLFALLAGHLTKAVRVPEITGYILAGVALGPSALGWLTHETLTGLEVFSEVALGLILFSIGSVFEISRMVRLGRSVARVVMFEASGTALLMTAGMLVIGQPWQVALMLGAVAIETGAASTVMVLRECNARGPFSEMLTAVLGLNNIACLVAFALVTGVLDFSTGLQSSSFARAFFDAAFPAIWQFAGSAALGYLIGIVLAAWASRAYEEGERLILLVGAMLLCVGVSSILNVSGLIASLAVGATMVNLSSTSRHMYDLLSRTDPPLYAIFFVIAGADLDLAALPAMGAAGVVYVLCRAAGKLGGARLSAQHADVPARTGMALLAHAGLAVGLMFAINQRFPELAPAVNPIVLSAVVIYEIIGPLGVRWMLNRCEIGPVSASP
jgi:Kef-type K+ transport system membrane component KefB